MRRSGPLPSVLLAFALLMSPGFPGLEPATTAPTLRLMAMTELKAGEGGHFSAKAEINGHSLMVLVDTGASAVALSYQDAEVAGLRPHTLDYVVPVATANGETKAARAVLRKVEIDGVRVHDVEALVLPKGAFNGTLLGMSFLGRLRSFAFDGSVLTLKN
jgi:aspartyl protease family protein